MAKNSKKVVIIHYVFIPSKLTGSAEFFPTNTDVVTHINWYRAEFAFNIEGVEERFIPSFERSGVEIINIG